MAEAHVDRDMPDRLVKWFAGYGPSPTFGPCPHADCAHNAQSVIAWGPSLDRYELAQCDVPAGCDGGCRAWINGRGQTTTTWLRVQHVDSRLPRDYPLP